MGHFPALPHRSIAAAPPQSTDIRPVEVRAGLVGFMTIRPRLSFRPFLRQISLAKKFSAVSFDYLLPSCEIPSCIKTRAKLLTNLLIRGKVVP